MIPEIGIMVGLYIVTRMLLVLHGSSATRAARVLAFITVLVSLVVMADLALRGTIGLNLTDLRDITDLR